MGLAEDEMPEVTPRVVSHGFMRGALVARIGGGSGPTDGGGQAVNAVGSLQADVASAFVTTEQTSMARVEASTVMVDAAMVDGNLALKATSAHAQIAEARIKGYEGESCGECGNFTLVRNGTCLKCDTCGSTSGCS